MTPPNPTSAFRPEPLDSMTLDEATRQLSRDGFVLLHHVIPPPTVAALRDEFAQRQAQLFKDAAYADSIKVGHRRYLIALELSGGFAEPLVYANPAALAVAKVALGDQLILESFGVVLSLPGAEAQHVHRDGEPLFETSVSLLLPAHALTFVLPLVDMDELRGTTALWPGTHRQSVRNPDQTPVVPIVPVGSCLLWDFRLSHAGTANTSNEPRPILYCTYSRPWFKDRNNFARTSQRNLSISPGFLETVPEEYRGLFAMCKDER